MAKGDWKEFANLPVPEGVSTPVEGRDAEIVKGNFKAAITPVDAVHSIPKLGDSMVMKCRNPNCVDHYYMTVVGNRDYFGFCSSECKSSFDQGG